LLFVTKTNSVHWLVRNVTDIYFTDNSQQRNDKLRDW